MATQKSLFWYRESWIEKDEDEDMEELKYAEEVNSQNGDKYQVECRKILNLHIKALFKTWLRFDSDEEIEDHKHFDILALVLAWILNRNNKEFKHFINLNQILSEAGVAGENILDALQDLARNRNEFKNLHEIINIVAGIIEGNSISIKPSIRISYNDDSLRAKTKELLQVSESFKECIKENDIKSVELGIEIDINQLMQSFLKVSHGDTEALIELIEMLSPLFKKYKGATEILEILSWFIKGEKKEILNKLPKLIDVIRLTLNKEEERIEDIKVNLLGEIEEQKLSKGVEFLKNSSAEVVDDGVVDLIKFWSNIASDSDEQLEKAATLKIVDVILKSINSGMNVQERKLPDLNQQREIILFIIGIWRQDFSLMIKVASHFGIFDDKLLTEFFSILKKFESSIFTKSIHGLPEISKGLETTYFAMKQKLKDPRSLIEEGMNKLGETASNAVKSEMSNKAVELSHIMVNNTGTLVTDMVYKDLFLMFDKDESGYISYGEFKDLCRYMGVLMNEERTLKMFAIVDCNGNNYIEYDEFSQAITLIKLQIARDTLHELGLTTRDLILFGSLTLIYLILAMVFIFFGIFAFSQADGFNAVINSIFPLAAGVGAATRSIGLQDKVSELKNYIADFIKKLKRK